MRETSDKILWGHVEKFGKGNRGNYNAEKKTITFCFKRGPQTSSEQLKAQREVLMKQLKELGYASRMKYNGEVIADNVANEDVTLVTKNHQLIIQLKDKTIVQKEKEEPKEPT